MPDQGNDADIYKIVIIGTPSELVAKLLQPELESPLNDSTEFQSQEAISEIHEVAYRRFHFTFNFTYSDLAIDISEEGSEKKGAFYHEAAGAISVWDYEYLESVKDLKDWLKELRVFTSKSLPVILLGIKNEAGYMSPQMVRETAANLKLELFETSIVNSSLLDKLSDIFIQKLRKDSFDDQAYLLKICVIGSVSQLKSKFIHSFVGYKNPQDNMPTLGVDIRSRKINVGEIPVKLIVVDTAGQEFFGKLRPSYYRGASAASILFDKCSRQTFNAVPYWLKEFQTYIQPDVPIALVGLITHCEENSETLSFEECQALATQLNMKYFESKPTDLHQAFEIFTYLSRKVIEDGYAE